MKVAKRFNTLLAFKFDVTDTPSEGFERLKEDVESMGGSISKQSDTTATITYNDGEYTLSAGYILVLGNGSSVTLNMDQFYEQYQQVSGQDLESLELRVAELERSISSKTKK